MECVDLLLFVLESEGGCIEGTFPRVGVRGCLFGLECADAELLKDVVELLNPPLRKLDSIFTGDEGLKDFAFSPSGRT
jgi:hypothetical protein